MRPRRIIGAFLCVVVAVALVRAVRGNSPFHVAAASPMRDVLVYAKPAGPCCNIDHGAKEQIWLAASDGSGPRLLTDGTDPSISPDGRYVAYDSDKNVLVMATSGGASTTIANGAAYPSWAPNSRFLAYYGAAGLVVVDVATGKKVTTIGPDKGELPDGFAFSPDSQRIAYTLHGDLYVVRTRGGSPIRLTHDHKSVAPVWGRTGIAFARFTHRPHSDIWLSDGRQHGLRQVTHTGGDAWPAFFSASGRELLAATPAMHAGMLWSVDVPSGSVKRLSPPGLGIVPQGLSSDGTTVLAGVGCTGNPSPFGWVETIPFTGGKPHVIARGPCRASWNAGVRR